MPPIKLTSHSQPCTPSPLSLLSGINRYRGNKSAHTKGPRIEHTHLHLQINVYITTDTVEAYHVP